jgi:hypothetical protein
MKKNLIAGLAVLFALLFAACDKNEMLETNLNTPAIQKIVNKEFSLANVKKYSDMLVFNSFDDFHTALYQVEELTGEKRMEWEKSLGFQSFGRIADEFYQTFDIDSYSDAKEIFAFFETNSDKVLLKQSGDTITLSAQKAGEPERWVMNEKKMYIIDETVYRYFEDDIQVLCEYSDTNSENIEKLRNVVSWQELFGNTSFRVVTPNPRFKALPDESAVVIVSTHQSQPPCPSGAINKKEWGNSYVGNKRTRLKIYNEIKTNYTFSNGIVGYGVRIGYEIVNEKRKKVLGFLWSYGHNVEETVHGSIVIKNRHCVYDAAKNLYVVTDDKAGYYPTFDVSGYYSKISGHAYKGIQYNIPNTPKPWSYITDWDIYFTVSNGITHSY